MQFEKINEVALLKTHISQTKVWNEQIGDTKKGWGWLAKFYDDNYLVVNTYDIDGNIKNKKIKNDKAAIYLVDKLEAEKDEEYLDSLADMEN